MSITDDLQVQDDILIYLYEHIVTHKPMASFDPMNEVSRIVENFPDKNLEYIDRQLAILERKDLIELMQVYANSQLKAHITGYGCQRAEEILLDRHTQASE